MIDTAAGPRTHGQGLSSQVKAMMGGSSAIAERVFPKNAYSMAVNAKTPFVTVSAWYPFNQFPAAVQA